MSRVIQRALTGGVDGMIIISNDLDKQDVVSLLVKQYTGSLFACVGIHPDNVKRTNDKLFQQRQESLKDIALMPETVAIMCGLDWTREFATRFPQEKLLVNHFELAHEVELPVVVTLLGDGAAEKLCEKINEADTPQVKAVAVFDFLGTAAELDLLMKISVCPVYIMISGIICDPTNAKGQEIRALLPKIPRERLLLCSDSPKYTPQNIDDPYIREQKNEPSNMPWVVREMAAALDTTVEDVGKSLRENAKTFFKLYEQGEGPAVAPSQPKTAEASTGAAAEESDEEDDDDLDEFEDEEENGKDVFIPKNPGKPLEFKPRTPAPLATPSDIAAKHEAVATEKPAASTGSAGSAPAAKPAAGAANPATKEARYACILCRHVLVTTKDVIPHEQGLDQLKDLKRARNDVEFDSSNVMFVHEVNWMKERSDAERAESPVVLLEGKLDCPKCGSKRTDRIFFPARFFFFRKVPPNLTRAAI